MRTPTHYSDRLGAIADAQFAAATERFDLGRFLHAEPARSGLFGQNVFVTTSSGEFVLRGVPHWVRGRGELEHRPQDSWQFAKEAFFVNALHEHTRAPVPWPYLVDERTDIFGWRYALMPRMPGTCFEDRALLQQLDTAQLHEVAQAMGANLALMQQWQAPEAGDIGVDSVTFEPEAGGAVAAVQADVEQFLRSAVQAGTLDARDVTWIERTAANAAAAAPRRNTYVHVDYKLGNLTLLHAGDGWRVGGLFDFHEGRFGDGLLDLVRQSCTWLDTHPGLAGTYVAAYRAGIAIPGDAADVLPLYVLNDRLKIWDYFARPEHRQPFTVGTTFRDWCVKYVEGLATLLRA